jgi:DNA-binding transcriptional MerR regulator
MKTKEELRKVGELARETGISVRTLHWYDEIGLLSPSHHTASGHRLYAAGDIARLAQIRSLRALGFTLDEVRGCLLQPGFAPRRVVGLHIERLREQMDLQRTLCRRLEAIARHLDAAEEVSAGEFLKTIEGMTMLERYVTPEQMAELHERGTALGDEQVRSVEAEWPTLIASMRAEMDQGTNPADPRVQQLARRWRELLNAFSGGNAEVEGNVARMYNENPDVAAQYGLDGKLFEYVSSAWAADPGPG